MSSKQTKPTTPASSGAGAGAGAGSGLNVIALVSGGKDSLFSILHCLRNGHNVVALANLYPPPRTSSRPGNDNGNGDVNDGASGGEEEEEEDMDSFMYQTIGHSVIPLYESALQIPLYRGHITGGAVDTSRVYRDGAVDHMADTATTQTQTQTEDETESLLPLLRRVLAAHPHANAVSAGAILSTYQRTRIENVAARLRLTPLAWLWQYPVLPPPEERKLAPTDTGLLDDMAAAGCEARIIKVASGGLDERVLWGDVSSMDGGVRRRVLAAMRRYFTAQGDLRGAVLGEGGEYETLALDGPGCLWKKRIVVDGVEEKVGEGGVAFVGLKGVRCVDKEDGASNDTEEKEVRRPGVLDAVFESVLEKVVVAAGGTAEVESGGDGHGHGHGAGLVSPTTWPQDLSAQGRNRETWTVCNVTAPEAGADAAKQMEAIVMKIRGTLAEGHATTGDIVFATVLLRAMGDFPHMNAVYNSLFNRPNPPARATVACGEALPDGVAVMVSLVVDLGARDRRQALHVQSRSYWAPANIGPYSQAVSVPLHEAERMVYVAGQIPLDPASMDMVDGRYMGLLSEESASSWEGGFALRTVLAMQHLWRIGTAMQVDWWLGGVAYFTGEKEVGREAHAAWRLWELMHTQGAGVGGDDAEENESALDVWDIKYGGRAHERSTGEETSALPNFDIAQTDGIVPPFFAVQVAALPRGSDIEWQGLGFQGTGLKLSTEVIDDGQVIHTTTNGHLAYTAVELDLERSASDLESSLQRVLERYAQPRDECHCVLYTAEPVSRDAWTGQIVPCLSVWGQIGRRLAAGVVVQRRLVAN